MCKKCGYFQLTYFNLLQLWWSSHNWPGAGHTQWSKSFRWSCFIRQKRSCQSRLQISAPYRSKNMEWVSYEFAKELGRQCSTWAFHGRWMSMTAKNGTRNSSGWVKALFGINNLQYYLLQKTQMVLNTKRGLTKISIRLETNSCRISYRKLIVNNIRKVVLLVSYVLSIFLLKNICWSNRNFRTNYYRMSFIKWV